jgi:hypothetical protein
VTKRLWLSRLSVSLLGLVLALLLAEVGLRQLGKAVATPRLPLTYQLNAIDSLAAGRTYVAFDSPLGWVTTPAIDVKIGSISFHHTDQGLRANRTYSPDPPTGVRRLAAYGDSYTYCDEGSFDDCWTQQLESRLPGSEVLNFGVPGYSPDQAWLRYQLSGRDFHACAVLIGMNVENINRVVNRFRPFYVPSTGIALSKPRYVLRNDRLVLLPNPARQAEQLKDPGWVEQQLGPEDAWYFPGIFVANPFDRLELVRLGRTVAYARQRQDNERWSVGRAHEMYQPGDEAFDVLTAVLRSFANQVRADGASPVVLIFPWWQEIIAAKTGQPLSHAPLVQALRASGVAVIDFSDALGEAARGMNLDKLVGEHLRPEGNRVVARALARQLPELTQATCGQWQ